MLNTARLCGHGDYCPSCCGGGALALALAIAHAALHGVTVVVFRGIHGRNSVLDW